MDSDDDSDGDDSDDDDSVFADLSPDTLKKLLKQCSSGIKVTDRRVSVISHLASNHNVEEA
jgi:hypothetical protein